jgi:hypothetical protein
LKKSMPAVVEKKVLTAPAAKLRTATEAGGAAQTPASGATIQNQPVVQPANPLLPKVKLQSAGPAVR